MNDKDKHIDLRKETRGTGKVIEKPDMNILPERVVTDDGKIVNLDTGSVKADAKTIDLGGRVCDLDELGESGEEFIVEMYEEYLTAVHQGRESTYTNDDADLTDSFGILNYIPDKYRGVKKLIVWRTKEDGTKIGVIKWDEGTKESKTFEHWMILSLATLRWRFHKDMERRKILNGLSNDETTEIKGLIGVLIESVEKWLAFPHSKKVISV